MAGWMFDFIYMSSYMRKRDREREIERERKQILIYKQRAVLALNSERVDRDSAAAG
jgi:hypothetical protein